MNRHGDPDVRRWKSPASPIVGQPLRAHRAEVAQELPRLTGTPAALDERKDGNSECEECG